MAELSLWLYVISLMSFNLFFSCYVAPRRPPPPTVTVGNGGFIIAGLGPMEVVVEYVCNYTFVISRVTSQVRMKPTVTAEVRLREAGEYTVQVRPHLL